RDARFLRLRASESRRAHVRRAALERRSDRGLQSSVQAGFRAGCFPLTRRATRFFGDRPRARRRVAKVPSRCRRRPAAREPCFADRFVYGFFADRSDVWGEYLHTRSVMPEFTWGMELARPRAC